MLRLALSLVLLAGGVPMTDLEARIAALESQGAALRSQVSALSTEVIRGRRNMRDGMAPSDVAALLSPRNIGSPISTRVATDRTPDLATPLLSRLRDDASLTGVVGRTDAYDGYANILEDPSFDRLYARATTLTTVAQAIGPEWEAYYVLNSGTVATTRTVESYRRSRNLFSVGSSSAAYIDLAFGVNAADMDIVIETTNGVGQLSGIGADPSFLVAGGTSWILGTSGMTTVTANLEIIPGVGSTVVGESEDLLTAFSESEARTPLEVAYESPASVTGPFTYRLRIKVSKVAGAIASVSLAVVEPILAYSEDGSVPTYTPALGMWHPQQLVAVPFTTVNVPAGATTQLDVSDSASGNGSIRMPWGGSVVGVSWRFNAAVTGGTYSIEVEVNNANVWAQTALTAQAGSATQNANLDTFVADDTLGIQVVTSAGFTPATLDLVALAWVLIDYSP